MHTYSTGIGVMVSAHILMSMSKVLVEIPDTGIGIVASLVNMNISLSLVSVPKQAVVNYDNIKNFIRQQVIKMFDGEAHRPVSPCCHI